MSRSKGVPACACVGSEPLLSSLLPVAPPRPPGPHPPLPSPASDHAACTWNFLRAAKLSLDHARQRRCAKLSSALGRLLSHLASRRPIAIPLVLRTGMCLRREVASLDQRTFNPAPGLLWGPAHLHAVLANSGFSPLLSAPICVSHVRHHIYQRHSRFARSNTHPARFTTVINCAATRQNGTHSHMTHES